MKYWIKKSEDIWEAIQNKSIIEDFLKPKPYKEYRELEDKEAYIAIGSRNHLIILFIGEENSEEKVIQSVVNNICTYYPEVAKKHNLIYTNQWEYWR